MYKFCQSFFNSCLLPCLLMLLLPPVTGSAQYRPRLPASEYRAIWYDQSGASSDSLRLVAGSQLVSYYSVSQNDSVLAICQEMHAFGQKNHLNAWLGEADTQMGKYLWVNGDFQQALYYYKRSITYLTDTTSSSFCKALVGIGRCYGSLQQVDSCFFYLLKARQLSPPLGPRYVSNIDAQLGHFSYTITNDYPNALRYLFNANNLRENRYPNARVLIDLGNLLSRIGLHSESKKYLQEALQTKYETVTDTILLYTALINLYPSVHMVDSLNSQPAMQVRKGGMLNSQIDFWIKGVEIYLDAGALDKAANLVHLCVELQKKHPLSSWGSLEVCHARLLYQRGDYHAAITQCLRSLDIAQQAHLPALYFLIAQCYEQLGQNAKALQYFHLYEELEQQLRNEEMINQALNWYVNTLLQGEKEASLKAQASSNELAKQTKKYYENLGWLLIGICLTLCVIVLVYYRLFRQKKQAVAELETERQKLYSSNQQLQRFSSIVSHDILTNLDFILSTGNVLVGKNTVKPALQSYYEYTQKTCIQLKNYCLDLLETARKKPSEAPESIHTTDPMPVVARVLENYTLPLQTARFTVRVNPLPPAPLPPSVIEHFFQNLISNTLKYGNNAPYPALTISSRSGMPGYIQWTVENNGASLSPDQQSSILKGEIQNSTKGQGLGLASLIDTLHSYHTHLQIETPEAGGVCFVLYIPLQQPTEDSTLTHPQALTI